MNGQTAQSPFVTITLTPELIHAGATTPNVFTRAQHEFLGVAYPPKAGWVERCAGRELTKAQYDEFVRLGTVFTKSTERRRRKAQERAGRELAWEPAGNQAGADSPEEVLYRVEKGSPVFVKYRPDGVEVAKNAPIDLYFVEYEVCVAGRTWIFRARHDEKGGIYRVHPSRVQVWRCEAVSA